MLQQPTPEVMALPVLPDGDSQPRDLRVEIPQEDVADHLLTPVGLIDDCGEMELVVLVRAVQVLDHPNPVDIPAVEHRPRTAGHLVKELHHHRHVLLLQDPDLRFVRINGVVQEDNVQDPPVLVNDRNRRELVIPDVLLGTFAFRVEEEMRLRIRRLADRRLELAVLQQELADVTVRQ